MSILRLSCILVVFFVDLLQDDCHWVQAVYLAIFLHPVALILSCTPQQILHSGQLQWAYERYASHCCKSEVWCIHALDPSSCECRLLAAYWLNGTCALVSFILDVPHGWQPSSTEPAMTAPAHNCSGIAFWLHAAQLHSAHIEQLFCVCCKKTASWWADRWKARLYAR